MTAVIKRNNRVYRYKLIKGLPQCQDCYGIYSWEIFYIHHCVKDKYKRNPQGLDKWIEQEKGE
jgi:hypothetical protein